MLKYVPLFIIVAIAVLLAGAALEFLWRKYNRSNSRTRWIPIAFGSVVMLIILIAQLDGQ